MASCSKPRSAVEHLGPSASPAVPSAAPETAVVAAANMAGKGDQKRL